MSQPAPGVGARRASLWPLWVGAAALATVIVLMATREGRLSHRSVAEATYKLPIRQDDDCVRLEIQNGTVGVDIGSERVAAVGGGVRRAADSAEQLAVLEQIPFQLVEVRDPARPRTLILRGPTLPTGHTGLLGLELGIRLPAELALEVVVAGNGHVTIANRAARVEVDTGRGDLRFEHCAGALKAETGRGNVIVYDHRGDLDVSTAIGDMQAFVQQAGRQIRLGTGQGTVQCVVPPDLEFDLDARAEVGRIGADFELAAEQVGSYGAALIGKRGAATTRVVLRTGSGHIAFRSK